jgi:hypothetical protein
MILDAGEVWWFELPRVGRKPGVVCSRRAVNLRLMPVVARITTVARERSQPTVVAFLPARSKRSPRTASRSRTICFWPGRPHRRWSSPGD